MLYLSHYFKQHRSEYYERLQAVRLCSPGDSDMIAVAHSLLRLELNGETHIDSYG